MAENKEWYTQKEIAEQLGIPVRRLYGKVNTLRAAGVIKWREDPSDQRAILIHQDSLETIAKAIKESSPSNRKEKRPTAPHNIKRDDERLIPMEETMQKYEIDEEWIKKNLTRFAFLGGSGKKTTYLYLPEIEYVLDQVEIIPPERD